MPAAETPQLPCARRRPTAAPSGESWRSFMRRTHGRWKVSESSTGFTSCVSVARMWPQCLDTAFGCN
jgi:hypothetical protein